MENDLAFMHIWVSYVSESIWINKKIPNWIFGIHLGYIIFEYKMYRGKKLMPIWILYTDVQPHLPNPEWDFMKQA